MFDDDDYLEDEDDFVPDFYSDQYVSSQSSLKSFTANYDTPKKLYDFLDMHIYGHSAYKKAISVWLWKITHAHKPSGALLVAGETGSGKTELFRVLKEIYGNIAITDASSMVASGYKGSNTLTAGMNMLNFLSDIPIVYVID